MHIKTVNIKGEYKCMIMGHNDPFRFTGEKEIGPYIGLVFSQLLPMWIVLTHALTVAALRSFFCWRFDWYWSSNGPPSIKFMACLNSDSAIAPAVIMSTVGLDSTSRSTSLTYLLRCPTLISLSTRNFRLQHLLV